MGMRSIDMSLRLLAYRVTIPQKRMTQRPKDGSFDGICSSVSFSLAKQLLPAGRTLEVQAGMGRHPFPILSIPISDATEDFPFPVGAVDGPTLDGPVAASQRLRPPGVADAPLALQLGRLHLLRPHPPGVAAPLRNS